MKIAVTSTGGSLNAQVAPNFGRCAYFIIVNSEDMKFEPISNPGTGMMGGAGPAAARLINDRDCKVLLTGSVGPNAQSALKQFDIEVVTGVSGTVKEAVDNYLETQK
ncbi:NifB/NifX family molybdenum-iron cluster-binding protein [bacterium]|nr:NifB/NifX family molybdenum-iron cluster-binding protein [bacterium]